MKRNYWYYSLKPYLPWRLRMAMRGAMAQRLRRQTVSTWPIDPAAARPPAGWPGWPEGKRFAFVLTHDVETSIGLDKCPQLLKTDREFGFRSCFNFIPEGDYSVPAAFRQELAQNGFETGVHDLRHDGKLYWTHQEFIKNAERINHYLKEWKAGGFRSGFMFHNLDWIHELELQYDSSTFDTDPFEPQPDGSRTIFPFWVPGPRGGGYVELPYTLPQDSTMFLLLQEPTVEIWKKKLDWIAEQGGMALLNVHPDYIDFTEGPTQRRLFPVALYREFLAYVQTRYVGKFWQPLPGEVATYARQCRVQAESKSGKSITRPMENPNIPPRRKIWIDLDNTPHVPFFEPIIKELERRGHSVVLTARDAFQVCDLANHKGLKYVKIGRHYGKNKLAKVTGLFYRALQLFPFATSERPDLAVSHGARSQIIISNLLGIPSVLLADYEFTKAPPTMRPSWEIVPDVIPQDATHIAQSRVRTYPGIKEDVYVPGFRPSPDILRDLGLQESEMIITVRPPATEAHYHNPESETLFKHFMERAVNAPNSRVVLLPRNQNQKNWIKGQWPHWFANDRTIIPGGAVDGLNLLFYSDLVVSGGGTMNREAAALGVPVYSIFRGPTGAVDHYLQKEGRLMMIESVADVDTKIKLERRTMKALSGVVSDRSLMSIVDHLEKILAGTA